VYQICIDEELIYRSTRPLFLHLQAKDFRIFVFDTSLILTSEQMSSTEFAFSEFHIILIEINTFYDPSGIRSVVITGELRDQS